MIHYQLRCDTDHGFDGWFRDSTAFDRQAKAGLLTCPTCGSAAVARALMTPALGKTRAPPQQVAPAPAPAAPATAGPTALAGALPDAVRAVLQRMRSEVEKHCEYVGPGFADEARRIHNGESKARGIYGETSPEQAEQLAEDGIEVGRMPWLPRADS